MKIRVSGVPYEVEMEANEQDIVSELGRENFMLNSRNQRLEDEIRYLETRISDLTIELTNLKIKGDQNASRID